VVAVPVRADRPVLHDVALALDPGAVVTDVGSTKAEVDPRRARELRALFPRFVPATRSRAARPRAWTPPLPTSSRAPASC
jgi:hypothetical protein